MHYVSTRGTPRRRSFNEVLLAGLAPDGGLYVPLAYPQLSVKDLKQMRDWSYNQIAFHILRDYVGGDIRSEDLWNIIQASYNPRTFGSFDITPIQPLGPNVGLLKLSNGPTLAFKDVALQLVANLMNHVLEEREKYLNILGATSGDTGSAAEEAIRGRKRLSIFMLSPFGRMTKFQEMQMYRINDPSVHNLVANGNFDDCQAAVKLVNADADFKREYSIGAVNSINWARIVAQVVYYVYAYTRMTADESETLTVSVPSGNFGNALAAYVAAKMGCKLRIIVATNENDVLTQFFRTGTYQVRKGSEVKRTLSPSMDIAEASNFERLMFDVMGRDSASLQALWHTLSETGQFHSSVPSDHRYNKVEILSDRVTDADVLATIKIVYQNFGVIIDPHTAVATMAALDHQVKDIKGPIAIVETAQPAKFELAIMHAIGLKMPVHPLCKHLESMPDKITRLEVSSPAEIAKQVKHYIAGILN